MNRKFFIEAENKIMFACPFPVLSTDNFITLLKKLNFSFLRKNILIFFLWLKCMIMVLLNHSNDCIQTCMRNVYSFILHVELVFQAK